MTNAQQRFWCLFHTYRIIGCFVHNYSNSKNCYVIDCISFAVTVNNDWNSLSSNIINYIYIFLNLADVHIIYYIVWYYKLCFFEPPMDIFKTSNSSWWYETCWNRNIGWCCDYNDDVNNTCVTTYACKVIS